MYDSEKLSEGYWFMGPKGSLDPTIGTAQGWFGPAIYDGNGELIWSGSAQLDTPNIMGFEQQYVDGKQRLTMLDRDRHLGTILDNDYEIHKLLYVGNDEVVMEDSVNGHELNFVEAGKSVIFVKNNRLDAPQEDKDATGFVGSGECISNFNSFVEMDLKTGKPLYEWLSYEKIRLQECTIPYENVNGMCDVFDFM